MIPTIPDLGLIAGETVTVRTPTIGYDEHMEEVPSWSARPVENVVVTPGATSDVLDSTRPDGTRVAWLSRARARHRVRRHRRPAAVHAGERSGTVELHGGGGESRWLAESR